MTKLRLALTALTLTISSNLFGASSGFVTVTSCTTGSITLTASTIAWLVPASNTVGCIATNTGTNIAYTGGGPLLAGNLTGEIKNLPAVSNLDFMVWADQPNLHFDLVVLGPGSANTTCATILDPNAAACSVAAGSPYVLKPTATGTSVSIAATGIVRDSSSVTSTWMGGFSTQFPGITPADLQTAIVSGTTLAGYCSGGACSSSYTGSFLVRINGGSACPGTIGFWKNAKKHPFPSSVQLAGGLSIGGNFYTVCDLYTILNNNGGDAIANVGRQLVAARLNVAAGAQDNAAADAAMADAESRLQSNGLSLLTSTVSNNSTVGTALIADATVLSQYNNANFGSCTEGAGLNLGASANQCQ